MTTNGEVRRAINRSRNELFQTLKSAVTQLELPATDETYEFAENIAWDSGACPDPDSDILDELRDEPGFDEIDYLVIRAIQYRLLLELVEREFTALEIETSHYLFPQFHTVEESDSMITDPRVTDE